MKQKQKGNIDYKELIKYNLNNKFIGKDRDGEEYADFTDLQRAGRGENRRQETVENHP